MQQIHVPFLKLNGHGLVAMTIWEKALDVASHRYRDKKYVVWKNHNGLILNHGKPLTSTWWYHVHIKRLEVGELGIRKDNTFKIEDQMLNFKVDVEIVFRHASSRI